MPLIDARSHQAQDQGLWSTLAAPKLSMCSQARPRTANSGAFACSGSKSGKRLRNPALKNLFRRAHVRTSNFVVEGAACLS
jgi:hypothetical protein